MSRKDPAVVKRSTGGFVEEFTLSLQPETQGRTHEPANRSAETENIPIVVSKSELKFSLEKNCRGSLASEVTCHRSKPNPHGGFVGVVGVV